MCNYLRLLDVFLEVRRAILYATRKLLDLSKKNVLEIRRKKNYRVYNEFINILLSKIDTNCQRILSSTTRGRAVRLKNSTLSRSRCVNYRVARFNYLSINESLSAVIERII